MRAGPAQADRAGLQDDAGDKVQHRPSLETQPRAPLWGHQPGAEPCVRHKAGEEAPPRHLVLNRNCQSSSTPRLQNTVKPCLQENAELTL